MVNSRIDGIDELLNRLRQLRCKGNVKAGILEGAHSQNVGSSVALGGSNVLDYAPIQEFGGVIHVTQRMRGFLGAAIDIHLRRSTQTIIIPPRPFLRNTFEIKVHDWEEALKRIFDRSGDVYRALYGVGSLMKTDIIETIKNGVPPPNSEATTRFKEQYAPAAVGKTLQFTGTLLKSIDFKVTIE